MAKDIKLIIGGDTRKAREELEALQKTGRETAGQIEKDFVALGSKSSLAFEKKRQAAQSAYESIKSASNTTAGEIQRAEKALADRLVAIDSEQFGKRESLLAKFKANWLAVGVSIATAWKTISKGVSLATEGAAFQQQATSFANLSASYGLSADKIIADLQKISGQTISVQQTVEQAGKAMVLGVQAEYLPKLMEMARASAKITGETTGKAFNDLVEGVAKGSAELLNNLGIIVKAEEAYKKFAAAHNTTVEALTAEEKQQSILNDVLAKGADLISRTGNQAESDSDRLAQFSAAVDNIGKSIGLLLSGPLSRLAKEMSTTVSWFDAYKSGQISFWEWAFTGAETASQRLEQLQKTNFDKLASEGGVELAKRKAAEAAQKEAEARVEAEKRVMKEKVKLFNNAAKDIIDIEKSRIKNQEELERKHLASLKSDYERTVNELNVLIDTKKEVGAAFDELQKKNQASIVSDIPETEYDKYLKAHDKFLEEEKKIDGTWADPNEKAKRYAELAKKYEAYNKAVVVDGQEVISGYEAQADAAEAIERLQRKTVDLIDEETAKRETAAVTMAEQMIEAENRLNAYANRVSELDNILRNLPKVVDVDINLNISNMSSLAQVLAASGYRNYGDYYTMGTNTYWADGTLASTDPWFTQGRGDTGIKYVPKTGLYMLHRGETVKNRDDTAAASRGNVSISPQINITMQGASTEPNQTARELARMIEPELRAIAARYRK